MSTILKECKKILKEAKSLQRKSYLWFPGGQLIPKAKGIVYDDKRFVNYKGVIYEKGNEYNGVVELFLKGKLKHIVKRKSNGTFFKWHL